MGTSGQAVPAFPASGVVWQVHTHVDSNATSAFLLNGAVWYIHVTKKLTTTVYRFHPFAQSLWHGILNETLIWSWSELTVRGQGAMTKTKWISKPTCLLNGAVCRHNQCVSTILSTSFLMQKQQMAHWVKKPAPVAVKWHLNSQLAVNVGMCTGLTSPTAAKRSPNCWQRSGCWGAGYVLASFSGAEVASEWGHSVQRCDHFCSMVVQLRCAAICSQKLYTL